MGVGLGGGGEGGWLRMEYFVGVLKIYKLFLPNSNLSFLRFQLSEKKLSITSGKQSKLRENAPPCMMGAMSETLRLFGEKLYFQL